MIIRVQHAYNSTWSNTEDKPQVVDDGTDNVPEVDYEDADGVLHIMLSCDHDNFHNEPHEVDTMRNGEHDTYTSYHVECDDCGEELDIEVDYDEPDY